MYFRLDSDLNDMGNRHRILIGPKEEAMREMGKTHDEWTVDYY